MADAPNVPWTTKAQVVALPAYEALQDEDDALMALLCDVASAWLWRATGRQYPGESGATTVRPVPYCSVSLRSLVGGYGLRDSFNSRYGTFGYGGYGERGEGAFEVQLGVFPVRSVTQVVVDGVALPGASYRVDDDRWLVRQDGLMWPTSQDWTKPSGVGGGVGTWEVTLTWGASPPDDGVQAARVLAGELALANTNAEKSRLNPRIQSVARQGTNMLLMDPMTLIQGDSWGLREVDLFVAAANPNKLQQRTGVLDPQHPRAVRS